MQEKLAVAPTGSAWLSKNVPGFKNMRASYRWIALAIFGFWALLLLLLARTDSRQVKVWSVAAMILLILSNLPHPSRWKTYVNHRHMFLAIDRDLVTEMRQILHPHETVAFLPYRNDFLVNYLAARLNIKTYNIGGDKNLEAARGGWPPVMRQFQMGTYDPSFADRVLLLLTSQEADTVVLPYIDMLWAAHRWPAPPEFQQDAEQTLREIASLSPMRVERRKYYAIVRLPAPPMQKLEHRSLR
jgi:hypothetical protein